MTTCPACAGSGEVFVLVDTGAGGGGWVRCRACGGSGRVQMPASTASGADGLSAAIGLPACASRGHHAVKAQQGNANVKAQQGNANVESGPARRLVCSKVDRLQ